MKKKYQKPTINKIDFSMSSKYGSPIKTQKIRTNIDGISVKELTNKYGSPLFVFSYNKIKEKFDTLKDAFSKRYPKIKFSWSYKTNYLNEICKIYHSFGSIAEVVSEFEYQKARALGISGKDIIFNGPYKPKEALKVAIDEGAKIHIDHFFEIYDIEEIAKEKNIKVDVAIRVNMDTGIYPAWSRFGFNYESNEAYEAMKIISKSKYLNLNGLHTHIGTFMLSSDAYSMATEKIMKLRNIAKRDFGFDIEYIDLGGGFASKNNLKGIYQSSEVIIPTADEYAQAIVDKIYELANGNLPTLYLETGRHLIDEAGYLLSTIWAYKRLPDGKKSYILDAGVNILYTSNWYNFNIELDKRYDGENEISMLNGPLCMNIDVIYENIMLPPLNRGTILTISPVGAYNYTQSMQFIRYRPAVVLIKDKKVKVIKEIDNLESVNFNETS